MKSRVDVATGDEQRLRVHLRRGDLARLAFAQADAGRDEDLHGVRRRLALVLAPTVEHAEDQVGQVAERPLVELAARLVSRVE